MKTFGQMLCDEKGQGDSLVGIGNVFIKRILRRNGIIVDYDWRIDCWILEGRKYSDMHWALNRTIPQIKEILDRGRGYT